MRAKNKIAIIPQELESTKEEDSRKVFMIDYILTNCEIDLTSDISLLVKLFDMTTKKYPTKVQQLTEIRPRFMEHIFTTDSDLKRKILKVEGKPENLIPMRILEQILKNEKITS